jgi:Putative restriction endonuclease
MSLPGGGRVVMMPRASRFHGRIVTNLVTALRHRLDRQRWDVIAEFGLDAGPETLRYPDVVVDHPNGADKAYTTTAPVLLAEVLSPSTAEIDLGEPPSICGFQAFSPISSSRRRSRKLGFGREQAESSHLGRKSLLAPRRLFASPPCSSRCPWPMSMRASGKLDRNACRTGAKCEGPPAGGPSVCCFSLTPSRAPSGARDPRAGNRGPDPRPRGDQSGRPSPPAARATRAP